MLSKVENESRELYDNHQISEPWIPKHIYELYGLVSHSGSMKGGHYVSYQARSINNNKQWYYISDAHVSEVREEEVLKVEAYMLFYLKIQ